MAVRREGKLIGGGALVMPVSPAMFIRHGGHFSINSR